MLHFNPIGNSLTSTSDLQTSTHHFESLSPDYSSLYGYELVRLAMALDINENQDSANSLLLSHAVVSSASLTVTLYYFPNA